MTGYGKSFGSVTILNAVLCGRGAAFGTSLETKAEFSLTGDGRNVRISNDPEEDDLMARRCVKHALSYIGKEEPECWTLATNSQIPVSRGMKSSSSACNAIISAVADEFNVKMDKTELVRLGVRCARSANVTLTGAFDDACSCHFGGMFLTDNEADDIIISKDIDDVEIVYHVPEQKVRKRPLPISEQMRKRGEELAAIAADRPFHVLTENGRWVSALLGSDDYVSKKAMKCGAVAAGITGFGPATAIVLKRGETQSFLNRMNMQNFISTEYRRYSYENDVLR